jgi:Holliday junction resolvase
MKEEKINIKSDIDAKQAFVKLLVEKGYSEARIISSPADIAAMKNGVKYYFEIKFTNKQDNYFGAATLTEWAAAIDNPGTFKFVIAQKKGDLWTFTEYTPDEFMKFNTIPPFKTYFNINLDKNVSKKKNKSGKSIKLSEENLKKMNNFWKSLKE